MEFMLEQFDSSIAMSYVTIRDTNLVNGLDQTVDRSVSRHSKSWHYLLPGSAPTPGLHILT